ncbi:STY4851/ECs_5259 family protein [Propionivibrio sp.]|jgi:hypothetical protein|uniref:STY4851/ECs_5259 family protein n=1 Tax=Propionivibrio sp. TaxID=2212460 RepID=UPI00263422D4|nr:STY4851/ECs_5259 family protein [Propionivibrio sp.]
MAENNKFSVFTDWKRKLLSERSLAAPDGRALYLYRLNQAEFGELEALLAQWLGRLDRVGLALLPRLSGFSCLFVLYGSEWWRRRFDGSHWSWEPILRSIGADPHQWTQGQRSECVRLGLQDWGLKPREQGALRFLGTVAVQGGLPLELLAKARGRVGQLLSQVLTQARNGSVTSSQLLDWVRSLQSTLPKSYRQDVICTLLADVAWTVLQLKDEAGLTSSAEAIATLNQKILSWRDRFPLPIDDSHAQALIEQLIRDAASVRIERQSICLPLERRLVSADDGLWSLNSSVTLPDSLPAGHLATLFAVPLDDLPRSGELAVVVGETRKVTTVRRMAGNAAFRVERRPWGFSGDISACEHGLHLAAPDGRRWSATAAKGESLDDELPWVFSDEDGLSRFLRQGSGGVPATQALVALRVDWKIRARDGSELTVCGRLNAPDRLIYRVYGSTDAWNDAGLSCRIRTGQANSTEDSYEWRGQRLWFDFQSPPMAFRGLPALYRIDQNGAAHKVDGNPGWSVLGTSVHNGAMPIGPVSMRYPASGDVKQRARLAVLPEAAALSMRSCDAGAGEIRLENWKATTARMLTEGVRMDLLRANAALVLSLSVAAGSRPPERVDLEVLWSHTTVPVRLRIPFPGQGVRAFNANGSELRPGSLVAAERIAGIRLLALDGGSNKAITVELHSANGNRARIHRLIVQPGSLGIEVRLQDYATDIQHLLSADDNPDAKVRVVLRIGDGDAEPFRIDVARYAAKLVRSGQDIGIEDRGFSMLTADELAGLPMLALRLEQPGDEPIRLDQRSSEGVPRGCWAFEPEEREPGCWLIYPGPGALFPFRPTLWTVAGEFAGDGSLAKAIGLADPTQREADLDAVISELAVDFRHAGWTEVERLADQVGHLPLATLDLWRRVARSPTGMAALAVRFGTLPRGFVERFDQELPFAWETVSLGAWRQAIGCLERQCAANFGREAGPVVFRTHLDSRIKDLVSGHGALHYLLGIASSPHFPDGPRQVRLLWLHGSTNEAPLLLEETSALMRLRQCHSEDQWPTGSSKILDRARHEPNVTRFMCAQHFGYPDGAINMPLLLAAQVATGDADSWFRDPGAIHILREHRAFDPEWFDHAFNETIARALACALLN